VCFGDRLAAAGERRRWAIVRDELQETTWTTASTRSAAACTGPFGSGHLDACVRPLPLLGFLEPCEPLCDVTSTVEVLEEDLAAALRRSR